MLAANLSFGRDSHLYGNRRLRGLIVIDILVMASHAVAIIEVCGYLNPAPEKTLRW